MKCPTCGRQNPVGEGATRVFCSCGDIYEVASDCPRMAQNRSRRSWVINAVIKRRKAGERGVGDTVKRLLGVSGATFEKLMKWAGIDCGCPQRRERLNAEYNYAEMFPGELTRTRIVGPSLVTGPEIE